MNRGVPGYIPEATIDAIGARTDILALARSDPFDRIFRAARPRQIWWMKLTRFGDAQWEALPRQMAGLAAETDSGGYTATLWRYPMSLEADVETRLGAKGSTGFRLADLLVRFAKPRWVTLFGYTFWEDTPPGTTGNWHEAAYPAEAMGAGKNPHSGDAEKRAMLALGYRPHASGVYQWRADEGDPLLET
jgi:hypothetical protein